MEHLVSLNIYVEQSEGKFFGCIEEVTASGQIRVLLPWPLKNKNYKGLSVWTYDMVDHIGTLIDYDENKEQFICEPDANV